MTAKPFQMIGQRESLSRHCAPGNQHLASYSTLARAQAAAPKVHPDWLRLWIICPDGARVTLR